MSQEIRTKFSWNGNDYAFDVRDADDSEKLEKAVTDLTAAEKNSPKNGTASSIIRYQCRMIKNFFDTCLGKGAGEAICTTKNAIDLCYEPYDEFLRMCNDQKRYINDKTNVFRQYSNRDQRRHPQNPGQNRKYVGPKPVK